MANNVSFIYHRVTAVLITIATLGLLKIFYLFLDGKVTYYNLFTYVCMLSIGWGIHGLIHLHEEDNIFSK